MVDHASGVDVLFLVQPDLDFLRAGLWGKD